MAYLIRPLLPDHITRNSQGVLVDSDELLGHEHTQSILCYLPVQCMHLRQQVKGR